MTDRYSDEGLTEGAKVYAQFMRSYVKRFEKVEPAYETLSEALAKHSWFREKGE